MLTVEVWLLFSIHHRLCTLTHLCHIHHLCSILCVGVSIEQHNIKCWNESHPSIEFQQRTYAACTFHKTEHMWTTMESFNSVQLLHWKSFQEKWCALYTLFQYDIPSTCKLLGGEIISSLCWPAEKYQNNVHWAFSVKNLYYTSHCQCKQNTTDLVFWVSTDKFCQWSES